MRADKNNFQQYQEELESGFEKESDAIKQNLQDQRGFWSFWGDMVELYVSKVVTVLLQGNTPSHTMGISESSETPDDVDQNTTS